MAKNQKPKTIFYFVRHGETEWNVARKTQGHLDSPLTEKGKLQALQTANLLKDIHFHAAYSSDSGRALNTAKIITDSRKLEVTPHQLLRERFYGRFEGTFWDKQPKKVQGNWKKSETLLLSEKRHFSVHTDIETDQALLVRTMEFIRVHSEKHAGEQLLVVTHGGVIWNLLTYTKFPDNSLPPKGDVKNASYMKFISDGENHEIAATWNIDLE